MPVHPSAIVDSRADIDEDVRVDAYAVIDGPVRIATGTHVYPHSYITGWTDIGPNCRIHPGAVIGHEPQDRAYDGAETYCTIGADTVIREGASVHRGTAPGSHTRIGQRCLLMGYSHVAHNCEIADDVILANLAALAGHCTVGPRAFVSGDAIAHQFVRIGELAMVAGKARVPRDVPPFMMTDGEGRIVGLNVVGLRRAGYDAAEREALKQAYRLLYRESSHFSRAARRLLDTAATPACRRLAEFVCADSRRGCAGGRRKRGTAIED